MNGNSVGKNIKELRQTRGFTQGEFAQILNVAKSSISSYENGARLPSYDVLIKIAQVFHVSTDNLLGYNNKHQIEVSGLNARQHSVVIDIIEAFVVYNQKSDISNTNLDE